MFMEMLYSGRKDQASSYFYTDLAPYNESLPSECHQLSDFLSNDLPVTRPANDREDTFQILDTLIRRDAEVSTMFFPPVVQGNRLETLLEQSLRWQFKNCNHSTASLLCDHHCNPAPMLLPAAAPLYALPQQSQQSLHDIVDSVLQDDGFQEDTSQIPATLPQSQALTTSPPFDLMEFESQLYNFDAFPLKTGASPQHLSTSDYSCDGDFGITDNSNQGAEVPHSNPPVGTARPCLPKEIVRLVGTSDSITDLEFHPNLPLLLACTKSGETKLYRLNTLGNPYLKKFKIWNLKKLSKELQVYFEIRNLKTAGAICVAWGSHTTYAVGFADGLVQTYIYADDSPWKQHIEIEAHRGAVNDVVFFSSQEEGKLKIKIVTCGDDGFIRVWDFSQGIMSWALPCGNPLNTLALRQDGNTVQLFSSNNLGTAFRANIGHQAEVCVTGCKLTRFELRLSNNGNRLFSCTVGGDEPSTQSDGLLLEIDRESLFMKTTYNGVKNPKKNSMDICKDHYIAVGDEFCVKVWNVDNENLLAKITIADPKFPESPMVKFNREGSLLAVVSLKHVRILANADGKILLGEDVLDSVMLSRESCDWIWVSREEPSILLMD
ncbi:unnamed protein product [Microthlaspi erraticum]|uniref:Uncharacterized protein n=1 Tax=Microthlaspi erraticum TaxID=1685480 RepID=A0A6D2KFM4_9BRAS|nr:unnamed protein product [Microthlaspi erraticum]